MIQVFYDGQCGLCDREINYYRRKDTSQAIEWVDVTQQPELLQELDISLATALKHLHARQDDGLLLRGVDAFILIWQRIPGWQTIAKLANFLPVKKCLELLYEIFAWVRFKSYRHCRISERP